MPNHFCTIGLCSVSYEQLERLGLEEPSLESLISAQEGE